MSQNSQENTGVRVSKVTSRNAFIVNLFATESERESKNDETTLSGDCLPILDLSVNP